ncbi:dynamin-related protein dnm1 [Anaeramoeba flamelloides]|uniref:Dynamin-related protein dnm1 n=1 Tax=Anaeramoeba flamelloides TaxID=1746091 RepID=A0AAV7YB62_9EUKA|nr:dynamin-related protein dnm1 [Anaeramoeba flamelloides]
MTIMTITITTIITNKFIQNKRDKLALKCCQLIKNKMGIFDKKKNPLNSLNNKCYFRIRHPSGRSILHNRSMLELFADDEKALKIWVNFIKRAAQGGRGRVKKINKDIWLIREVVTSYFRTAKITLFDSIPKAIMFSMVNPVKRELESRLMVKIYDEELLDDIMSEDPQS